MENENRIYDEFLNGKKITDFEESQLSFSDKETLEEIQLLSDAAESFHYAFLKDKIKEDIHKINQKKKTYRLISASILLLIGGLGIYFFTKKANTIESVKNQSNPAEILSNREQTSVLEAKKIVPLQDSATNSKVEISNKVTTKKDTKQKENINPVNSNFIKTDNSISTLSEKIPIKNDLKEVQEPDTKVEISKTPKPCTDVKSQVKQRVIPSCIGQNNGEIYVNAISGITFKYKNTSYQKIVLTNLLSGNYIIHTSENNNCSDSINIFVPEKKCIESKRYNYNPTFDSPIRFECNNNCKFELKDKSGLTLLSQNSNTANGIEFNAKDAYGADLNPGTYIYTIIENESPIEVGQITIVK